MLLALGVRHLMSEERFSSVGPGGTDSIDGFFGGHGAKRSGNSRVDRPREGGCVPGPLRFVRKFGAELAKAQEGPEGNDHTISQRGSATELVAAREHLGLALARFHQGGPDGLQSCGRGFRPMMRVSGELNRSNPAKANLTQRTQAVHQVQITLPEGQVLMNASPAVIQVDIDQALSKGMDDISLR